jgi:hypothetical protein
LKMKREELRKRKEDRRNSLDFKSNLHKSKKEMLR